MPVNRDAIVEHLQQILGSDSVFTDTPLLQQRSIDNFRKLQNIFDDRRALHHQLAVAGFD